jgi:hypothetical protein
VKPLVMPVSVTAKTVRSGTLSAMDSLQAQHYCTAPQRAVAYSKKSLLLLCSDLSSEAAAVKSALFSVYAALPQGALQNGPEMGPDDLVRPRTLLSSFYLLSPWTARSPMCHAYSPATEMLTRTPHPNANSSHPLTPSSLLWRLPDPNPLFSS